MNAHTKQQQDKVFETDFIDSQKPDPPICAPFGTKSHTHNKHTQTNTHTQQAYQDKLIHTTSIPRQTHTHTQQAYPDKHTHTQLLNGTQPTFIVNAAVAGATTWHPQLTR